MLLLDSTIIIEVLDATPKGMKIQEQLQDQEIATTALNMHEILRTVNEKNRADAASFFEHIPVYGFTRKSAEKSAPLENYLKKSGTMINKIDILIAAICQELNATLVTRDRDFLRVPNLSVQCID